ncbi:MAG: flagellar export chaperone FliS [Pseudomonadota bacterium]
MTYSPQSMARDYRQDTLESSVAAATPQQLIRMLMQKLLANLSQARAAMEANEVNRKGELIGKSVSIIDCLRASLDISHGGEVAENLERLYAFMLRELTAANLHNQVQGLNAVIVVVEELKSAWDTLDE